MPAVFSRRPSGFTLMEMAIVMIVIGLIFGGVIAGQAVIKSSELRAVKSDITTFSDAVSKFEEQYGGLPGDIANATGFFNGAVNGNGNGKIDGAEGLQVWRHLALAKLIPGNYDGVTNTPQTGLPPSKLAGRVTGFLASNQDGIGLVFDLTGFNGAVSGLSAISPEDALSMDRQYDDGVPTTGGIRAMEGSDVAANTCVNAAAYVAATKTPTCQLRFVASANTDNTAAVHNAIACGASNLGSTRTSSVACPVGHVGRKVETCQRDGSWQLSHDYCRPVNCGGGIYNDTKTVSCPARYSGTQTYTCGKTGVWTLNTDGCSSTGACSPNGATETLACPLGKTGQLDKTCVAGNWSIVGNCNTAITCPGGAPNTVGATRTSGTCPTNMTGSLTETCTSVGQWMVTGNTCQGATGCGPVGSTSTQACPSGQTGSLTLTCVAGTPTVWAITSTTCSTHNCDGEPIGAIRQSSNSCPVGTVGVVYDICSSSGAWAPSNAYCVTPAAPASANWIAVTDAGKVATSMDGITWTLQTISATQALNWIGYNDSKWMIAGREAIFSSTNGTTWAAQSKPSSNWVDVVLYHKPSSSWQLGDSLDRFFTSTNSTTWTNSANNPLGSELISAEHNGQAAPDALWIATGTFGNAARTNNWSSWTHLAAIGSGNVETVAHNRFAAPNGLWIIGAGNGVMTSADGVTWSGTLTPAVGKFRQIVSNRRAGASALWVGVTRDMYIGAPVNGWVGGGEVLTSNNGTSWSTLGTVAPQNLYSLAHNYQTGASSMWVAGGENGYMMYSTNGTSWTPITSPFGTTGTVYAIANINLNYTPPNVSCVAVGANSKIATSANGSTGWAFTTSPATGDLIDVTFDGYGTWVAGGTGGKVYYSNDGADWTTVNLGVTESISAISHNQQSGSSSKWVAITQYDSFTSTDGITWTRHAGVFSTAGMYDVQYNPYTGLWMAGGWAGKLYTSSDGISWAMQNLGGIFSGANGAIYSISYNDQGIPSSVWVVAGGDGKIASSSSGTGSWTQRTNPSACSTCEIHAMTFGDGKFVSADADGHVVTSTNGTTWTTASTQTFGISSITHNGKTGASSQFTISDINGNGTGDIYTSTNGTTWTKATPTIFSGTNYINSVSCKKPPVDSLFYVAVGDGPTISYSNSASTAFTAVSTTATAPYDVAYGNGTWVIVGDNNEIFSSPGYVMTSRASNVATPDDFETVSHNGITGSGGLFIAGDGLGQITTSPDGVTWTPRTLGWTGSGRTVFDLDYNHQCGGGVGLWVAVGQTGRISTSPDGINWTIRSHPFGTNSLFGVAHNGKSGAAGMWTTGGQNGMFGSSPDGINWTVRNAQFGTSSIMDVSWGNNMFMAGGTSSKVSTSPDGITWTAKTPPFTSSYEDVRSIAHNGITGSGSKWVAVSADGQIKYSTDDGTTWTAATDPHGSNPIWGIASKIDWGTCPAPSATCSVHGGAYTGTSTISGSSTLLGGISSTAAGYVKCLIYYP